MYGWLHELDMPWFQRGFAFLESKVTGTTVLMVIEYIVLSSSVSYAAKILSYLACALSYPLIDQPLNQLDHMMGFDWSSWFQWFTGHVGATILKSTYYSFLFQTVLFITWFAYFSRKDRFLELFWIMTIGVVLAILVSGFLPAVGKPVFALHEMRSEMDRIQPQAQIIIQQVMSIRSGTSTVFTPHAMTGIVTFPSFHTVCAMAYAYGFRRTGLLGYGILLLNILVLLSIPIIGNHYLTDMIAGGVIGFFTIAVVWGVARMKNRTSPASA